MECSPKKIYMKPDVTLTWYVNFREGKMSMNERNGRENYLQREEAFDKSSY